MKSEKLLSSILLRRRFSQISREKREREREKVSSFGACSQQLRVSSLFIPQARASKLSEPCPR